MNHSNSFNQTKYFLSIAIVIAVVLAIPAQAFAVTTAQQVTSDALFCQNVNQVNSRISAKMQAPIAKIAAHPNTVDKATVQHTIVNTKLQKVRGNWDSKRNEYFTQMISKTKSDTQKAAVNTFKDSVNTAINQRRSNIDAATQAYFNASHELQMQYNQTIIDSSNTFQSDVAQSFSLASQSCQASADVSTVRTELSNNLKSARSKLLITQNNAKNQVQQINNLRKVETNLINESINKYKLEVEKSRNQLINDLKNSDADSEQLTSAQAIRS